MKKVEAIIPKENLDKVIQAIRKIGVGGLTVGDCKGQGAAEPPLVGDYFSRKYLLTVVNDDKVDKIMSAIADAGCTKSKADGKIFVTNVEEAMDICTKQKGTNI
ncbi:MAG: P-II family nitrogen regulator [Nitrosopumilaceae archaeon]